MSMREYQVFLKWTCSKDVVDNGTLVEWVDILEAKMGMAFARFKPLGSSGRVLDWNAQQRIDNLDGRIGAGLNQQVRIRLIADDNPAGIVYLNIQATLHPYTGRYVAAFELRIRSDVFEDPETVAYWASLMQRWAEEGGALSAQLHDADDDAIQNVSSAGLLKIGYGIEVDHVDVSKNPGRETSRGEYRYVVNWLSFYGHDMFEALGRPTIDVDGVRTWEQDGGLWVQLSDSPLHPDDKTVRERQRQVREQLAIEALAVRQQRSMGYWQRK